MAKAQESNLPAPSSLSSADFTALLRGGGAIETPEEISRIKVDGATFHVGDDIYVSNPKTKAPAFIAQIVEAPRELQAAWIEEDGNLARVLNEMTGTQDYSAGTMCKSHFDIPSQNREFSENGANCRKCPINPFTKKDNVPPEANGQKCKWRGELKMRVLGEDHTLLNGDATIWTLSLPTTGMIQLKGTTKDPENGHTGELTTMQRLVRLGAEQNPDSPQQGALMALTAWSLGYVIVEVRSLPMQSPTDAGRRYHVVDLNPIVILEMNDAPALADSSAPSNDDIPF